MHTTLVALMLFHSCAEADPSSTSMGSSSTGSSATEDGGTSCDSGTLAFDCTDLTAEECASHGECWSPSAVPVVETKDGLCVDRSAERTDHGCLTVTTDCGAAEVLATTVDRPEACLWLFPQVCLPAGFTPCVDPGHVPPCD